MNSQEIYDFMNLWIGLSTKYFFNYKLTNYSTESRGNSIKQSKTGKRT